MAPATAPSAGGDGSTALPDRVRVPLNLRLRAPDHREGPGAQPRSDPRRRHHVQGDRDGPRGRDIVHVVHADGVRSGDDNVVRTDPEETHGSCTLTRLLRLLRSSPPRRIISMIEGTQKTASPPVILPTSP